MCFSWEYVAAGAILRKFRVNQHCWITGCLLWKADGSPWGYLAFRAAAKVKPGWERTQHVCVAWIFTVLWKSGLSMILYKCNIAMFFLAAECVHVCRQSTVWTHNWKPVKFKWKIYPAPLTVGAIKFIKRQINKSKSRAFPRDWNLIMCKLNWIEIILNIVTMGIYFEHTVFRKH